MKIFLTGYMGSGKSFLGTRLAAQLNYDYIDLDDHIELLEGKAIQDIFKAKGELYFRKLETRVLRDVLKEKADLVVSLGGGTPCYGNNMELIQERSDARTVYLKASVATLTRRLLPEKIHRPVISHLDGSEALEEFIRKHLFERAYYYNQADVIVNVDQEDTEATLEAIKKGLT